MRIRDFLNACIDFKTVKIYKYIGAVYNIGAEPEDYEPIIHTRRMKSIPENLLNRKVEYWSMSDGNIDIFLEG